MSPQFFLSRVTLFLALIGPLAFAQKGGSGVVINIFPERQQERRQSRWTLDSWLGQKREIERQNRWLWQHTNRLPIEWALGVDSEEARYGVEAEIYLARLGLKARYSKSMDWFEEPSSDTLQGRSGTLAFQLRLFGGNLQDSSLVARGTYEYSHITSTLPQGLEGAYAGFAAGPELQLYLAQWIGVRGDWNRHFKRGKVAFKGQDLSGTSWSASAFLETGALRLEGGWRSQVWEFAGLEDASRREERLFGALKIFY